jgi:hypothetical protein
MSANIKASTDGTQAIIGVGGVDQMSVSNAGVVEANSFVGAMNGSSVTATGSTTARTLANRFADMPSIFDFGAVGDGVADDLPAFTAANNSGKLIFIPKPPVAYNVSSPIKMDKCAVLIDPTNINWAALTDNGNISFLRGKENGITSPELQDANFWRFTDRILVGGMANKWTGVPASNTGNAWFADIANYPGYLGVGAKVSISSSQYNQQSVNGDNPFSIACGVRTSDTLQLAIPIASCVVNDRNNCNAWGQIIELQHTATGANGTCGIEIALKNGSGLSSTITPYGGSGNNGIFGILMAGGGDNAFGPINNGRIQCGIIFSSGSVGSGRFNTGICFRSTSLSTENNQEAISFGKDHTLRWYESTGTASGEIICTNGTPNSKTKIDIGSSSIAFVNNSNFTFLNAIATPTSNTRLQVQLNSALQDNIILKSEGSNTNIDLALATKGNGKVAFGTNVATADAPITSYIEIKDASGNLRKLAVIS